MRAKRDKAHQIVPGGPFCTFSQGKSGGDRPLAVLYIVLGRLRATMYNEVLRLALIVIFA
jgi:hypothetical protein